MGDGEEVAAKFAVTVRFEVTLVMVRGLAVEVVNPLPVQLTKWWPALATAITWVVDPPLATVWTAVPVSVPPVPETNVTVRGVSPLGVPSQPASRAISHQVALARRRHPSLPMWVPAISFAVLSGWIWAWTREVPPSFQVAVCFTPALFQQRMSA